MNFEIKILLTKPVLPRFKAENQIKILILIF